MSDERAIQRSFEDIVEGTALSHEYALTQALVDQFVEAFGDVSPVHVDDAHARARGFAGRVAHGAILNGFLSHFVGMIMPGSRALLLSADLRYLQPSYPGARIVLTAKVAQVVASQRVIVLMVSFEDATRGVLVARGKVQAGVAEG